MATGSGSKEKMLEGGGSKGSKGSNNQRRIQREEVRALNVVYKGYRRQVVFPAKFFVSFEIGTFL